MQLWGKQTVVSTLVAWDKTRRLRRAESLPPQYVYGTRLLYCSAPAMAKLYIELITVTRTMEASRPENPGLSLSDICDKETLSIAAPRTPSNNKLGYSPCRNGKSSSLAAIRFSNRRSRNDSGNDISPCLRLSLPKRGLISKTRRKVRFHIRTKHPKKIILAGLDKCPVKFVCGIGIVSDEDLSPQHAKH